MSPMRRRRSFGPSTRPTADPDRWPEGFGGLHEGGGVTHRAADDAVRQDVDRQARRFERVDDATAGRLEADKTTSAAGMRMEPPPSLAWAIGTTPAATSAADPPDDAPVEKSRFHGFRVGGASSNSVHALNPNAGSVDFPMTTTPVERNSVTKGESAAAGVAGVARDPRASAGRTRSRCP